MLQGNRWKVTFVLAWMAGCTLPPVVLPSTPPSSAVPTHTVAFQQYASERLNPGCQLEPRNFVDLWWSLNFPARKQQENRATISLHVFHAVFTNGTGVLLPGISAHVDVPVSSLIGFSLSSGIQPGALLFRELSHQTSVMATLPLWITLQPYIQTGPVRFQMQAFPPGMGFIWTGPTWGFLGGVHNAMNVGYTRPRVIDISCPQPPIRETPVLTLGIWVRQ